MASEPNSPPDLDRIEWRAVSIALNDAAKCGCGDAEPGPVRRMVGRLTGAQPLRRLADPRLEAIRSFVCDARRYRRAAPRLIEALEAQGFNHRQIDALKLLAA